MSSCLDNILSFYLHYGTRGFDCQFQLWRSADEFSRIQTVRDSRLAMLCKPHRNLEPGRSVAAWRRDRTEEYLGPRKKRKPKEHSMWAPPSPPLIERVHSSSPPQAKDRFPSSTQWTERTHFPISLSTCCTLCSLWNFMFHNRCHSMNTVDQLACPEIQIIQSHEQSCDEPRVCLCTCQRKSILRKLPSPLKKNKRIHFIGIYFLSHKIFSLNKCLYQTIFLNGNKNIQ